MTTHPESNAWQETRSGLQPNDLVRVRGWRWRVAGAERHVDCEALTLDGVEGPNRALRRTFLYPFDRPTHLGRDRHWRIVPRRRWLGALRDLVRATTSPAELRTAAGARLDLLPHQLEPALAAIRGRGTRLLLADEVGLGKTIQAGLVLTELAARGLADRTLVLVPAGVRDQWASELNGRFGLGADVVDAPALERRLRALPAGVNPWQWPGVHIVSFDFLKRVEVLRAIEDAVWDVVIIDEAHRATSGTERGAAAGHVAARARFVLLLTATPHNGDDTAFDTLCDTGRLALEPGADRVLLFRHTRSDVGRTPGRASRVIRVRPTAAERRMHTLLDAYTARVWQEAPEPHREAARLAVIVLRKRALSSAASLASSVARRIERLGEVARDPVDQLRLPLGAADDERDGRDEVSAALLGAPGLATSSHERAWLGAVLHAAVAAARQESKRRRLVRVIARVNEPAIVFTEYRDTLLTLARALHAVAPVTVLHGGLSRMERADAQRRFTGGDARILVATDAAGEGLNLQTGGCRLVVHYELPWTPVRLEQRIGRVDRIGQDRRVHALHLVADGTAETAILGRLILRQSRIDAALVPAGSRAVVHDLGSERDVAEAIMRPAGRQAEARSPGPPPPSSEVPYRTVALRADADRECERLIALRRLDQARDTRSRSARRSDEPRRVTARSRHAVPLLDLLDQTAPWITALPLARLAKAGFRVQGAAPAAAATSESAPAARAGVGPRPNSVMHQGAAARGEGLEPPPSADARGGSLRGWGPASSEGCTPRALSTAQGPESEMRLWQATGIVFIFRVTIADDTGRGVESTAVVVHVPFILPDVHTRADVRQHIDRHLADLARHVSETVSAEANRRVSASGAMHRQMLAALLSRERWIIDHLERNRRSSLVQLLLFERRAIRTAEGELAQAKAAVARCRERLRALETAAASVSVVGEPELLLVIVIS